MNNFVSLLQLEEGKEYIRFNNNLKFFKIENKKLYTKDYMRDWVLCEIELQPNTNCFSEFEKEKKFGYV